MELTIPTTNSSLAEKTAFGAHELDRIRPGWYREIKLTEFDMGSGENCILGQLIGDFDGALEEFDWDLEETVLRGFYAKCSGGYECSHRTSYAILTDCWTSEVTNRRTLEREATAL